jgi:2-dehydropantoate 2-reductase
MRVGIIGGGSIGLLYAGYLSEGNEVTIFTRTMEQADEINKNGIVIKKDGGQWNCRVAASSFDFWEGSEDLTVVTVKQYQLEPIIDKLSKINDRILNVLFLQNGMGHLKLLSRLDKSNVFLGSVELGALKENANTVNHNGEGLTNLAVFRGSPECLTSFTSSLPESVPFRWNENYYDMLLQKLIINAVINPLTAILNVSNGMLMKNQFYKKRAEALFAEISFILNLTEPESYFQKVAGVCLKTEWNRSSMLKDIESGRTTEVDAIVGFLLEEAEKQGKWAPLLQNYYELVKGKEQESKLMSTPFSEYKNS